MKPAEILNIVGLNMLSVFPKVQTNKPFILCYHSIDNLDERYSVNPKTLEKHLEILLRSKTIIPLSEMVNSPMDKLSNTVAITFDDGYTTMVSDVMPIMFKYGIKPTLFVIGEHDYEKIDGLNKEQPLLSIKDIIFLKNAGWEIGYHTKTHKDLTKMDSAALTREIIETKKELEEELGFNLRYFSYPYGLVNEQVKNIVKDAGFEAAFTTSCNNVNLNDKLLISRIPIEHTVTPRMFEALVTRIGFFGQQVILALITTKIALSRVFVK